jgi:carboxymethylenebutenolidase
MCYDGNARPPDPPGKRGEATGRDLVLTAGDGNQFHAYLAEPADGFYAQVLIYPDIRGLHRFYKDLALRFAEVGVRAIAMDYFGRSAGLTERNDEFDWQPHVAQMSIPTCFTDAAAALDVLQKDSDVKTFVLGFCMGGTLTLITGTRDFNIAGLVPFYSGMTRKFIGADGTALELAHKVHYPVLGLYGGADQGIPVEMVHALDEELDKAKVPHELVIYPGAPHSFFDRKQTEFAKESADAWARVIAFMRGSDDAPVA